MGLMIKNEESGEINFISRALLLDDVNELVQKISWAFSLTHSPSPLRFYQERLTRSSSRQMNERVFFDIIDLEEESIRHRSLRTERKIVPRSKWCEIGIFPFASLPLPPVIRLPRAPLAVIRNDTARVT